MDILPNVPSVRDFYKDSEILITGGTGFIGKVLIERLLTDCSNFKKIYLILRERNNKPVQERIKEFSECDLFDGIDSKLFEKIIILSGDSALPGLGLSQVDRERLKNVSVIFHCAASVRFNEALKTAILLNVRGTRDLCMLATQMKNLKAFVHVSTAYCNHRNGHFDDMKLKIIREELYPDVDDYERVIKIAENTEEFDLNSLTSFVTRFEYNTYLYAKALSESVCKNFQDKLPLVMYRPAIVIGYGSGPKWGWCANLNGPLGTSVSGVTGLIRIFYCVRYTALDVIMVDCCVNGMIIAAWKRFYIDESTTIYNSTIYKYTINQLFETGKINYYKYNFESTLWTYRDATTTNFYSYRLQSLWQHFLPALLIDKILEVTGNKPRILKIRRIATDAFLSLYYFMSTNFEIFNHNFIQLEKHISAEERKIFRITDSASNRDSDEFILRSAIWIQKNILKEKMDPVSKDRIKKRIILMNLAGKAVNFGIYGMLMYHFVLPFLQANLIQ